MKESKQRVVDSASKKMLARAEELGINTAWDRFEAMQPPCKFGTMGLCCKNCNLGPCRLTPSIDNKKAGVCGADADTISARNLARHIAAGSACHSDHGREIARTLFLASTHAAEGYEIKDEEKLRVVASECGIKNDGRP